MRKIKLRLIHKLILTILIDPSNITNFDRTKEELEEFLLFAIVVAGKTAKVQAKKLNQFLQKIPIVSNSPFQKIRYLVLESRNLEEMLREVKIGKYNLITPSFRSLSLNPPDLNSIGREELESYTGIGPKTSRFFILHSRKKAGVACLDVHILKWLKDIGINTSVPSKTPRGKKYLELENIFLKKSKDIGMHPAKLDLNIWNYYSGNANELVF